MNTAVSAGSLGSRLSLSNLRICRNVISVRKDDAGRSVDHTRLGIVAQRAGVPDRSAESWSVIRGETSPHDCPPRDQYVLRVIPDRYAVPVDDLVAQARAYKSRPPPSIEVAKNRLLTSIRLIEALVERGMAERRIAERRPVPP